MFQCTLESRHALTSSYTTLAFPGGRSLIKKLVIVLGSLWALSGIKLAYPLLTASLTLGENINADRFVKIRHYGLLCSRNIKSKLNKCLRLTGNKSLPLTVRVQKDSKTCRSCGSTQLITFLVPFSSTTVTSP